MSSSPPPEPAQTLFHSLETASSFSREAIVQVGMTLLQHLLDGQPVSLETLEKATGRTQKEIDRFLNQLETEREENGDVVGLGLSLRPTPHQYVTGGNIFYGWCAPDTLVYPPSFSTPHTLRPGIRSAGRPSS